jgi:glycogen synthase
MNLKLNRWKRDWALMSSFFNADEISTIAGKLKDLKIQNVVFCSFENRFAKSGGLAPVTINILPYLKEVNKIPSVILMTPFYPNIIERRKLKSTGKHFNVPFNNKSIRAELYEFTYNYSSPKKGTLKEYYLQAEGFFESGNRLRDPYIYNDSNALLNETAMKENAMLFCKAVPIALQTLGIRENIILHLQEWQTSLISLTSKEAMLNGTLESCGTVQTIHNSYDSSITREMLATVADRSRRRLISRFPGNDLTAYQIGLQLVDAPVTTVSEHIAAEFTTDNLQTDIFAPHLQNIFRKSGVYGINNGTFADIPLVFAKRKKLSLEEIRKIKLIKRKALLRILASYKPRERFGDLTYNGRTISNLPDNISIIVMSGRLAPLQKGYDVLLRAVERFAEDEIKVVLTPMAVHRDDLDYFYEVACKCKGNVTVFPLKMERGYSELQSGSTFGIMPSIYEPFGSAVEYMANGTVNIGRATGGLMDQIDRNCGFLYREDAVFYTPENIRNFVETGSIVQMRKTNPWFQNMADNLFDILKKAIYIYRYNPDKYYNLIRNGFEKINDFSWKANVIKYFQVYEKVT